MSAGMKTAIRSMRRHDRLAPYMLRMYSVSFSPPSISSHRLACLHTAYPLPSAPRPLLCAGLARHVTPTALLYEHVARPLSPRHCDFNSLYNFQTTSAQLSKATTTHYHKSASAPRHIFTSSLHNTLQSPILLSITPQSHHNEPSRVRDRAPEAAA